MICGTNQLGISLPGMHKLDSCFKAPCNVSTKSILSIEAINDWISVDHDNNALVERLNTKLLADLVADMLVTSFSFSRDCDI